MATMRAIVFRGPGQYGVQDVPRPELRREDDVIVRVQAAGICGTDLHALEVPPTFPTDPGIIMGHEYTGEVVNAGDAVTSLQPGDRVAIEPNINCLMCAYCRRGMPNMCLDLQLTGFKSHGGWAEESVMPARALHKVPDSVSPDVAALTEPLSCVLGGTDKVKMQPGETVVILGGGPIGLLYLQVFKAAGAGSIILVEPHAARADYARDFGATLVVNPTSEDVAALVRRETEIGADVVVDAVGSQFPAALKLLRRRGTVLLFGVNDRAEGAIKQFDITWNEYRILGSLIGTYNFPHTLRVLASGAIDAERMISARIGMEQLDDGLAELRSGRALKVLVKPNG